MVSSNEGLRDQSNVNRRIRDEGKGPQGRAFQPAFPACINQLDNPMRISAVKKDIARIKTILRENELKNGANA